MLEKSGSLLLTSEDLKEYHEGKVSQRIQDTWGLTLEELRNYIDNNKYEVINNNG